jgi:hypothetical protein
MQVDSISEGAGDPRPIAPDICRGANAPVGPVAGESAGTWIHRTDQCESRGIPNTRRRADYRDMTVLERLTHRVERMAREFQHLIEKQHPAMRQADLSWTRARPTSNEARNRHRVMRGPKRPRRTDTDVAAQQSRDRLNGDYLERLALAQPRKNAREASRQQRLPTTRWPAQEKPMTARCRDLDRATGYLLANDIG